MREGFRLARTDGILSTSCRIFDVIDGQRGVGRGRYGTRGAQGWGSPERSWLLLILQVLLVIVYIYSVLLAARRPYLPSRYWAGRGRDEGCSRHTSGGLCLQVQKATTICDIKIQGRLKLQNAPARLIKNDPTRKNNRAHVLSSHSYFSVRRDRNGAIICANWIALFSMENQRWAFTHREN